jgi:starch-binding outer membrane protein, SusD/RagB family
MHRIPFGGRLARSLTAAALAATAACSGITDTLLEAVDPDLINPNDVNSLEGARGLAVGTVARLTAITGGAESTWLFGGLLADEWATSSTFVQNDETDQRRIQENNSQVGNMLYRIYRVRTSASQALAGLKQWEPTAATSIGEMYFARGFAELQLASDFCNGIPLSNGASDPLVYGPVSVVFASAIANFDSALAAVGTATTDTAAVAIARAARVAKARAQLGLNQVDAAAATVAGIPTSFAYRSLFSLTTSTNTIWGQGLSALRYTVGDSV